MNSHTHSKNPRLMGGAGVVSDWNTPQPINTAPVTANAIRAPDNVIDMRFIVAPALPAD